MAKERLLIHGSSWSVGAYEKSPLHNSDIVVPGGIGELLKDYYAVTNISVQDNMNFGIWLGLCEHLKTTSHYDKILICQNDPSLDFGIWRNNDNEWLSQFPYTQQEIIDNKIDSINGIIEFLLDRFYSKLGEVGIPVYIFAGSTKVNVGLAKKYNLNVIEPDWMSVLVPTIEPSYIESGAELDYITQWLFKQYPTKQSAIKKEFVGLSDVLTEKLNAYKGNSALFAYHHPTTLGNELYFETIREALQ